MQDSRGDNMTEDRTHDWGLEPRTHTKHHTGHRTQDTGHRTQDTGHRTQDTGHRIQDTHATHTAGSICYEQSNVRKSRAEGH